MSLAVTAGSESGVSQRQTSISSRHLPSTYLPTRTRDTHSFLVLGERPGPVVKAERRSSKHHHIGYDPTIPHGTHRAYTFYLSITITWKANRRMRCCAGALNRENRRGQGQWCQYYYFFTSAGGTWRCNVCRPRGGGQRGWV